MNLGLFGWALIVTGGLIGLAGGILVFAGQRIVSDPERFLKGIVVTSEKPAPVLDARQDRLLERIWEIQRQTGLEYLVIGMQGRIHFDDEILREQYHIDLKVEILRGDPAPEGAGVDPQFEQLMDGMPVVYLRRLDRDDPNKYMRMDRFAVVSVTEDGIRYLRKK